MCVNLRFIEYALNTNRNNSTQINTNINGGKYANKIYFIHIRHNDPHVDHIL